MKVKEKVGLRIKELRKEANLSQNKLAILSNLHRTYINSVENSRRNISILNIEKISRALGISVKEFFNSILFKKD